MTTNANLRNNYRTETMEAVAQNGANKMIEMTDSVVSHFLLSCSIFYISSWSIITFVLFLTKMMAN